MFEIVFLAGLAALCPSYTLPTCCGLRVNSWTLRWNPARVSRWELPDPVIPFPFWPTLSLRELSFCGFLPSCLVGRGFFFSFAAQSGLIYWHPWSVFMYIYISVYPFSINTFYFIVVIVVKNYFLNFQFCTSHFAYPFLLPLPIFSMRRKRERRERCNLNSVPEGFCLGKP